MSDDWSAFALVWQLDDSRYAVKCHFWIPEETTRRQDGRPYDHWTDSGLVTVTPGTVTDYDTIETEQVDRVRVIRFNRPAKLNAVNDVMAREFGHALQAADEDPSVGAIVTTGNGRADFWEYYDEQKLVRVGYDRDGDGKPEYFEDSEVLR